MLSEVIHLTTSDLFQKEAPVNQSERIVDAFIESCKALDASIFEPFMEENNVFEDKNKYLFLANLRTLFETFKVDKPVSMDIVVNDGTCKGCKYGKSVKMFSVNGWDSEKYNDRFAYVIEKENGILKDIFRCNYFGKK
ncbi:MAG: hypothetical protein ABIN74_14425 [Ferruginibacter sp.]